MNPVAAPEMGWLGTTPLSAGASLSRYAWLATNLDDVRRPAGLRGSDTLIPHVGGVVVNPRRRTATRRLIEMLFTGDCDPDGDPGLPAGDQVWLNVRHFAALVMPGSGDPRFTLSVEHGSVTWAGPAVVEDFDFQARGAGEVVAVLDVSLTRGQLEIVP